MRSLSLYWHRYANRLALSIFVFIYDINCNSRVLYADRRPGNDTIYNISHTLAELLPRLGLFLVVMMAVFFQSYFFNQLKETRREQMAGSLGKSPAAAQISAATSSASNEEIFPAADVSILLV